MDRRLADARLYLVCPRLAPERLAAALDGGVDVVQLRMKDADDEAILREATWMREACAARGVPFLLDDDPALARRARADGVHVGQDDAPVAQARSGLGAGGLVGLSTHAPQQLAAGLLARPDYVAAGPVWATPTKPGRPAVGLDYVSHVAAHAGTTPWFAIGGIDRDTVAQVVEAGAERVVVVRAITEAADPAGAAAALRDAVGQRPPTLAATPGDVG